jgi:hypothetical protein
MSNALVDKNREELFRLRECLEQMKQNLIPLGVKLQQQFKELAGPILHEMLESRTKTERYLDDPNPKNRCIAVCLINQHWGSDEQFAIKCEKIIREDPDPEVRGCAVSCLGVYYRGSNHVRIGRILAELVLEESESTMVRETAYRALFELRGLPAVSQPSLSRFRFPDDVDWVFTKTFL